MIRSNILYSDMFEHDGRIGRKLTFLGSTLLLLAYVALGWAAVYAAMAIAAVFQK
jgi:fructose-1,6-bisphosphatase/inositol monophosphatase family enzyme